MKFFERIRLTEVVTWLICLLMIVPILIVVTISFGKSSFMTFPPHHFSLRWYGEFFSSPEWMSSLGSSLMIATLASLIATTLGFLGAWSLVRGHYGHKKLIVSFCLLPLIVPTIISSIALYFASVPMQLVGSKVWIAVCHSSLALPIVLLILIGTLHGIDRSIEQAAQSLGASTAYTFVRVILPMAAPGVVSAAFFSFLTSFDELVISLFLSGVNTETLPVRIWNSLVMNMEPVIAAISSFLIMLTVSMLALELLVRRIRA